MTEQTMARRVLSILASRIGFSSLNPSSQVGNSSLSPSSPEDNNENKSLKTKEAGNGNKVIDFTEEHLANTDLVSSKGPAPPVHEDSKDIHNHDSIDTAFIPKNTISAKRARYSSSPETLRAGSPVSPKETIQTSDALEKKVDTTPGIESNPIQSPKKLARPTKNQRKKLSKLDLDWDFVKEHWENWDVDSEATTSDPENARILHGDTTANSSNQERTPQTRPQPTELKPFGPSMTGPNPALPSPMDLQNYEHDSLMFSLLSVPIKQEDLNDMGMINGSNGWLTDICMRYMLASEADLTGSHGVALLEPSWFTNFDLDDGVDVRDAGDAPPSFFFAAANSEVPITKLAIPWQRNNHWVALYIDLEYNIGYLADSLNSKRMQERAGVLLHRFFRNYRSLFQGEGELELVLLESAQQRDGNTCGFYAAKNLAYLTRQIMSLDTTPFQTWQVEMFRVTWGKEMRKRMMQMAGP